MEFQKMVATNVGIPSQPISKKREGINLPHGQLAGGHLLLWFPTLDFGDTRGDIFATKRARKYHRDFLNQCESHDKKIDLSVHTEEVKDSSPAGTTFHKLIVSRTL